MRIRLIRDDLGVAAGVADSDDVIHRDGRRWWRCGAIIDVEHRACQILVGNGDAEPADDESEAACAGWQANRARVLESREMLAQGIEPEDREAYRRGELETDNEGAE
jgi:hypothetical protein